LTADQRQIESVLMGYVTRRTACISTQAGCAMAASFCPPARWGFRRHLTSAKLSEQVIWVRPASSKPRRRLTTWWSWAWGALPQLRRHHGGGDCLNDRALQFRRPAHHHLHRRPGADDRAPSRWRSAVNLAVSLHAATDDLRAELLPINSKYPLKVLFCCNSRYFEETAGAVTFEWALIAGKNDMREQARALGTLAKACPATSISSRSTPPVTTPGTQHARRALRTFRNALEREAVSVPIRVRAASISTPAAASWRCWRRPAIHSLP